MATVAHDWVHHYAERYPDRIALTDADTGEDTTWAELEDDVARLAHGLRSEVGLCRGDRLAVISDSRPDVFALQFACFRAGLVFTPLNWRLTESELAFMCADAGVAALVHDDAWAVLAVATAEAAHVARRLDTADVAALVKGHDRLAPTQENRLDDPAQILYTSGTTGFPKGAVSTYGTIVWNMMNAVQAKGLTAPGVNVYNPLPLFHAGGLNSTANPALLNAGRVTTATRFDATAALRTISDATVGITHIALVPVMYQAIADQPGFDEADLSGIRCAVVAGGLAPVPLLRQFADKGLQLEAHYGGTEMGPSVLACSPPVPEKVEVGSVGRPVLHTAVRLVDDQGLDVPDGREGEIWIKGPSVTPGYWGRDNAEFFTDGWFRTGDVARRDAEGYYYLVDRVKDMYKSGGENVYPAEVERLLLEHPGIAEVAVVGVPDERWGEVGLAVVVPASGSSITLDALSGALDGRLARYKHPKHLRTVEALPRNVTGKLDKVALRAEYGGSSVA